MVNWNWYWNATNSNTSHWHSFQLSIRVIQTGNFIALHPHFSVLFSLPFRLSLHTFYLYCSMLLRFIAYQTSNSLSLEILYSEHVSANVFPSPNRYWYTQEKRNKRKHNVSFPSRTRILNKLQLVYVNSIDRKSVFQPFHVSAYINFLVRFTQ